MVTDRKKPAPSRRSVQLRRVAFIVAATLVQLALFVAVGFIFVFLM